ncbi:GH13179 [Drosophila grimshawi]|uniref:GH13179 n=1 Tax=Drosophila grimshawi TaxID=7222 RepID=B4JU05_DROGR|nr:GH13179 [Drosophila grimshawi]
MASQDAGDYPTSRLGQMRMRFQQKTQEEQEQRRQELHNTQSATAMPSAASTRVIGNGKVRQMFDERRRGAGIDRSNPLKPIGETRQPQQQQQKQLIKGLSAMSLKEKPVSGRRMTSDSNNNNSKYNASGTVTNANRLKPVITRKTPPIRDQPDGQMLSTSTPASSARAKTMRSTTMPVTSVSRPTAGRVAVTEKSRINPKSPVTKIQMDTQPPEGMQTCRFCGRHFNTDRLTKHEEVCQRTMNTKRRIFDASKQRVKGTDAEKITKQQKPGVSRTQSTYSSAAQQQGLRTSVKKSNWRKKHEEFIEAIRAAKKVQAHLARGGKLSDLPPPPPSENPDYIQCPHCGRRFNQQAAERHIPRCATMIHNKPRRSTPLAPVKKR